MKLSKRPKGREASPAFRLCKRGNRFAPAHVNVVGVAQFTGPNAGLASDQELNRILSGDLTPLANPARRTESVLDGLPKRDPSVPSASDPGLRDGVFPQAASASINSVSIASCARCPCSSGPLIRKVSSTRSPSVVTFASCRFR